LSRDKKATAYRVVLAAAGVSCFALLPHTTKVEPLLSAAMLLGLCVLLSVAASASIQSLSLMAGSLAALAAGTVFGTSPALGGALLLGLAYSERTLRVRGRASRAVHVGLALLAGGMAAALAAHYIDIPVTTRIVTAAILAVLVMLPLVVEAEDALAHELDALAHELDGLAGKPSAQIAAKLREAAALRRDGDPRLLDVSTQREVSASWRTLLGVARARVRIEIQAPEIQVSSVNRAGSAHRLALIARLESSIEQHVTALGRTFTAAQEVRAVEASLDDSALRNVETSGESLEQMSRALVD
jgi:hypothetical protein